VTSIPPPGYGPPQEQPQPGPRLPLPAAAIRLPGRAGWRPWTAWAAIITGFGATVLGGLVVAIVAAATGASVTHPSPGVNIGLTFFQDLALIGAALLFANISGRPTAADFGLRRPRVARAVGLMIVVWIGFLTVSEIWVRALSLDDHQTLPDELGARGSTVNLALVIVLITVVAPLGEELFFRGYFFSALRNWRGFLPAAIVTGLIFGAVHVGSAPLGFTVPLAFFGFGLCVLYQRTGSLYPGIALHALNNSIALGLTQKWSWEILPTIVGSVIAALTLAALLARALGSRARGAAAMAMPAG
jgi:membrane protease YdiL (CAAX protease family)